MNHFSHPQQMHSVHQMMVDTGGGGGNVGVGGVGGGVVVGGGGVGGGGAGLIQVSPTTMVNPSVSMVSQLNGGYHAHPTSSPHSQQLQQQQQQQQQVSFDAQQQQQAQNSQTSSPFDSNPQQAQQQYTMYVQYTTDPSVAGPDLAQTYLTADHNSWNKPVNVVGQQQQVSQLQSNQLATTLQPQMVTSTMMLSSPMDAHHYGSWQSQPQAQAVSGPPPPQTPPQYQAQQSQQQPQSQTMFATSLDQMGYVQQDTFSIQQQQPQSMVGPTQVDALTLQLQTSPTKKPAAKSRKRADAGQPKDKIPTAYALFFRDTQPLIKQENSKANFGEISKIVSKRWEKLAVDAKEVYKQRANFEKKNLRLNAASTKAKQLASVQEVQQQQQQLQVQDPSLNSTMTVGQQPQYHQYPVTGAQQVNAQSAYSLEPQHNSMQSFGQDVYLNHGMAPMTMDATSSFQQYPPPPQQTQQQQQQQLSQQVQQITAAPPSHTSQSSLDFNHDSNSIHSNPHDPFDPIALLDFDDENFSSFLTSTVFMNDLGGIGDDAVFNDHTLLMTDDDLTGQSFLSTPPTPTSVTANNSNSCSLSQQQQQPQQQQQQQSQQLNNGQNPMIVVAPTTMSGMAGLPAEQQQLQQSQVVVAQQHLPQPNSLSEAKTSSIVVSQDFPSLSSHQSPLTTQLTTTTTPPSPSVTTEPSHGSQLDPTKDSSATYVPEKRCSADGCGKMAIESSHWAGTFCSGKCCLKHCDDIFERWKKERVCAPTASPVTLNGTTIIENGALTNSQNLSTLLTSPMNSGPGNTPTPTTASSVNFVGVL